MSRRSTPYGRMAAKLARLRDRENAYWKSIGGSDGDPRAMGQAARTRMSARMWPGGLDASPATVMSAIDRLLDAAPWLRRFGFRS